MGGTIAANADEAATEVARASGAVTETGAGVDIASAAGFGLTKFEERSPGRMARCGDRTGLVVVVQVVVVVVQG